MGSEVTQLWQNGRRDWDMDICDRSDNHTATKKWGVSGLFSRDSETIEAN